MRLGLTLSLLDYRRVGSSSILPTGFDMYLPDVASYLSTGTLNTANQVNTSSVNQSYIQIPYNPSGSDWSTEFITADFSGTDNVVVGHLGDAVGNINAMFSTNIMRVYTTTSAIFDLPCDFTDSDNKTYKIVVDNASLTIRLYIDGIQYSELPTGATDMNINFYSLSRRSNLISSLGFRYFKLDISGATLLEYNFTGGVGEIVYDSSGNGNDGIFTTDGTILPTWTPGVATPVRLGVAGFDDIITQTALMSYNNYDYKVSGTTANIEIDTLGFTYVEGDIVNVKFLYNDQADGAVFSSVQAAGNQTGLVVGVNYQGVNLGVVSVRTDVQGVSQSGFVEGDSVEVNIVIGATMATSVITINGGSDGVIGHRMNSIAAGAKIYRSYNYYWYGTVVNVLTKGVNYNTFNNWQGNDFTIAGEVRKLTIPEDQSNLTFDTIGEPINRFYLPDGLNLTGQDGHHYDSSITVDRTAKGVLGVEFNNGGANYAVPLTGWSYASDFFIAFKLYAPVLNSSNYLLGTTSTNNNNIAASATAIRVKYEGTLVTYSTTIATGDFIVLSRDAVGNSQITVNGGAPVIGSSVNTNTFQPNIVGNANSNGIKNQASYLNMNDENIYVFDERSGSTILDKVGSKDLTLTDIGNGLPTYVRSDDASTFIADDGEIIGGSTDAVFIKTEMLSQIATILGDDVFYKSLNNGSVEMIFNTGVLSKTVTISGLYSLLAFATDGYGLGKIYIGDADSLKTTFVIGGRVGDALATTTNMFIGNNSATGDSLNGYLVSPIHWGRQISEAELELYRLVTANKL